MNNRKSCQRCLHHRPISSMLPRDTVCHYLLDTGTPRGCPAEHCTHWQEATPRDPVPWLWLLHTIGGGAAHDQ